MAKRSTTLHNILVAEVLNDPDAREEYEAFKIQLELAEKLKEARQAAHLTQEKVAKKMVTHKAVIARLEASGGKGRHSPSIATVIKYAHAVGCCLEINLIPQKHSVRHASISHRKS